MRFEERVTVLCAEALAAKDEAQVKKLLTELRIVLHQRIEELRSGLQAAYAASGTVPNPTDEARLKTGQVITASSDVAMEKPRTWRRVVHEIASATDGGKALRLGLELTRLLQTHTDTNS